MRKIAINLDEDIFKSKNLVIIIGNGFDLAHENGETSYWHFSQFLLDKILDEMFATSSRKLLDPNFNFNRIAYDGVLNDCLNIVKEIYKLNSESKEKAKEHLSNSDVFNQLNSIFANQFIFDIFTKNILENWFDIENLYFIHLHDLFFYLKREIEKSQLHRSDYTINQKITELKKLNQDFDEVKNLLSEYLRTVNDKIVKNEQIENFLLQNVSDKQSTYIINFNYTRTIESYFKNHSSPYPKRTRRDVKTDFFSDLVTINYIHGNLEDEIIFGFGNDQDEKYKNIRDLGYDDLMENFKTFKYLHSENYSLLQAQCLEKFEDYDVLVLGHSLGMTDKTLLKEIFSNSKCKRIIIPKRKDLEGQSLQRKEFDKLTMNISRIMENDSESRMKILNFSKTISFPS